MPPAATFGVDTAGATATKSRWVSIVRVFVRLTMAVLVAIRVLDELRSAWRRTRRTVGGWWDYVDRQQEERLFTAEMRWLDRMQHKLGP